MKIWAMALTTTVYLPCDVGGGGGGGTVTAVVDGDRRIAATHQGMRRVPPALPMAYAQWIEVLDLSHNSIREVLCLSCLERLHTLVLDHNLVSDGRAFPSMPSLRALSLCHNAVQDAALFVPPLGHALPRLTLLSLLGNPASVSSLTGHSTMRKREYRQLVLSHLQHLKHLDGHVITPLDRLWASRLEKTGLLDRVLNSLERYRGSSNSIV